jgi:hypothetical protein
VAATLAEAAAEFADLARGLQQVGETELRRELYKAISDAAAPLARQIKDPAHLKGYMPKRYAAVLAADLSVTTHKQTGADPGVTVMARAPTLGRGGRKVRKRDEGRLTHPVFAQQGTPRREWEWKSQTKGMRAGFFTAPAQRAAPQVRRAIIEAVRRVERKAVGR